MKKHVEFAKDQPGADMTAEIANGKPFALGITANYFDMAAKGDVVIELSDYSAGVNEALGSDYSWVTLVSHRDKSALAEAIKSQGTANDEDQDWLILHFIARNFRSRVEVNHWLQRHHIPFQEFHDSGYGYVEDPPA